MGSIQRLGKSINGYFGERIDIGAILEDCRNSARANGWSIQQLSELQPDIIALTRNRSPNSPATPTYGQASSLLRRIYISSGIHGDEPAGPLAVRHLIQQDIWPAEVSLWLLPCLNPAGFRLGHRENATGLDLNREYLHPTAPETLAHIEWLKQQPTFDLCLCLHEDWESHGFYVYELNPENQASLAPSIVSAVSNVCPIDTSDTIEGRPAQGGIIRPSVDPRSRPQWPESFFLLTHKTPLSYTLEAPSDFPLPVRVAALTSGVQAALRQYVGQPSMRQGLTPKR